MSVARSPTIFYCCPDTAVKSAGLRTLYRHVAYLVKNGLQAAILHQNAGFQLSDIAPVPVRYLSEPGTLAAGDVLVVPEGGPTVMAQYKDAPVRKIVIAQNWSYAYRTLPDKVDWRHYGVERVLAHTEHTGKFLAWAMKLPVHVYEWGIRGDLFYSRPEEKVRQIAYIVRKQGKMDFFKRVLYSRCSRYLTDIRWRALDGLSEEEYAREIRRSMVFVTLATNEGLPCSSLEAMRSATIVAGYDGVGGQGILMPSGPERNCILAENEDYITLAYQMEPLLEDLLAGDFNRWQQVINNGQKTSTLYTLEREEASVVKIWREILSR